MARTVVGEVVYKVELDRSDFTSGIKEIESDVKSMGNSINSSSRQSTASLENLKSSIAGVVASAASLKAVASGIAEATDAYTQYQSAMNGVQAVANATGNSVSESMQVIKDATANGLLSESDAAIAVKNLELYGYTAQQAGQMIQVMTDAAVYNRQSNYSLSEAVRVTTEGIRMENSVLSDASGIQKNISKMYDEYAHQLGKTANNLTQAEKAQAVYNGYMQEGGIFAGNAEDATQTLAGSQAKLGNAITKVQQALGSMFEVFAPIISGIADFITNNRELVVGLATTVGIILGVGGIVIAIRTVIPLIMSLAASISSVLGPLGILIGLAAVIGGVVAGTTSNFDDFSETEEETADTTVNLASATNDLATSTENLGTSSGKSAKELAKLQKQIDEVYYNYKSDLKKIKDKHEDTIDDLTKQIEDANRDYIKAVDERNASFNVTEDEQKRKHQEKVDALMQQLNFLQKYNNKHNQEKLAQVQFALEREQSLYEEETADRKAELEIQNNADKESLQQRLNEAQTKLNEELAFMEKHRAELAEVQDFITLDEIEELNKRKNEQLDNLREQVEDNGIYGAQAGKTFGDSLTNQLTSDEYLNKVAEAGAKAGQKYGDNWLSRATGGLFQTLNAGMDEATERQAINDYFKNKYGDRWEEEMKRQGYGTRLKSFSVGGYTGNGNDNEVAGIVHKGEYVLPQDMVNQNTGMPKTMGQTFNITVNASGIMAITEQEKRRVGMELANAISQVVKARSLA